MAYLKQTTFLIILTLAILGCNGRKGANKTTVNLPDDPLFYINNIYSYWSTERYDTALLFADELMKLKPSELRELLQQSVSLGISESQPGAAGFINVLYRTDNVELKKMVEPIFLWSTIHDTQSQDSALAIYNELESIVTTNLLSNNKPELYALKSLSDMKDFGINTQEEQKRINELIVTESTKKLDSTNYLLNRGLRERRAYLRLLLRYAYFDLFELTENEYYLKMASLYSPDNLDKQDINGYFYQSVILTGDYEKFGYQDNFADYLIGKKRFEEALEVISFMAFDEPSDTNISKLKSIYMATHHLDTFKDYWYNFISQHSEKFPDETFKTVHGDIVTTESFIGKWVLMDIWGTWCVPCINELPDIEKFFQESDSLYNNQLEVFTLSVDSKNLLEFLTSNNYTFPVAEVEKEVVKGLEINGYPTKYLIFPDGNYRVIPFNANWVEYVNNYSLARIK